jgi:hypothetical protein
MTTRLSPRQERRLTTSLSDEQILQTASSALIGLGAHDVQVDDALGIVKGTTRATGRSWGEHVTVRIEGREGQTGAVVVRCEPWLKVTLVDWGEASRTIESIAAAFDRAVEQDVTGAVGDEPFGRVPVTGGGDGQPEARFPATYSPQRPIWETGAQVSPGTRRKGWYLLAGVIAILCLVGAVVVMHIGGETFPDRVEDLERVTIPGQMVLQASGPTEYTVYYEVSGAAQEDVMTPPLTIEVEGPAGQPVGLDAPGIDQTYALPGHSGRAVATFAADAPGAYLVQVVGDAPSNAVLAIGESLFGPLLLAGMLVLVAVVALLPVAVSAICSRTAGRKGIEPFEQSPLAQ